ncbi:hypothetical protein V1525DRAFT_405413 [Lipomyces kononenkoae]|uniref:Uncharacterized protein n=1 Tax=Lipomyces kononenkoae TaxID=34357 RepID=A0ACC3SZ46_LIPKO
MAIQIRRPFLIITAISLLVVIFVSVVGLESSLLQFDKYIYDGSISYQQDTLQREKSSVTPTIVVGDAVVSDRLDFQFLVPMSNSHFNFCRSLYTALINDYPPPTLINWGKTYPNRYKAHEAKIDGVLESLQKMKPDQYALIMDGFDIWYQLPYTQFAAKLLDFMQSEHRRLAIFGADKKCWPNKPNSQACTNVPNSTLPADAYGILTDSVEGMPDKSEAYKFNRPRWLNSGTVVGNVAVLAEIFSEANYTISQLPEKKVFSDQMFIAEVFGRRRSNMTLDYKSELFQTMTFSHSDVLLVDNDVATYPRIPTSQRRRIALNRISGTVPAVLHFNGPKEAMDEWWPKMWWSMQRDSPDVVEKSHRIYDSGGAFTVEGEFIPWSDLCGKTDVHDPVTWST